MYISFCMIILLLGSWTG